MIAIVMMKMFEQSSIGQFPGLPDSLIGKWRTRDTTFGKNVVEQAAYVRATCENGCGYVVLGAEFGIGISIWGLGSKWDRFAQDLSSLNEKGKVIPVLEIGNNSFTGAGNRSVLEAVH